eukprot:CAMPEP_0168803626 /NCGR_PEP_ID=MMETSP0726-20121227/89_1 /TAXON_ID=265536 /ORGANISM="Amphiprora sp., Strain CCMP467" /LENGTH=91 /DNA_ID=CAMNT_0008855429 /DNA_START=122 /DNA_END=398 /DNA_ORIENTATION=+
MKEMKPDSILRAAAAAATAATRELAETKSLQNSAARKLLGATKEPYDPLEDDLPADTRNDDLVERPEFNRFAPSSDVHLNFEGTGRGRGKR